MDGTSNIEEGEYYPQLKLETPADILKWVDSTVVVVDKITTTTTLRTLQKLVKLRFHHKYGRILHFIAEHEAFTIMTIQQHLCMSKNEVYPAIKFLEDFGYVEKKAEIKNRDGPPTTIYLLVGGDERKVAEARQLHIDLKPTSAPMPFDYFKYKDAVRALADRIDAFYGPRRPDKQLGVYILKGYVKDYLKAIDSKLEYDGALYMALKAELEERGWNIFWV